MSRLAELLFYEDYTAHLKVTTQNNIQKEITQNVKNYTVGNEKSLQALAATVNGGISLQGENILQVANIGLTQNHTSIGTASSPFKGNYDGQNQKIENVRINNSNAGQGLFGVAENATLENVLLGNGAISAGNQVGGLVGQAKNCEIRKIENQGTTVISKGSGESEEILFTQTIQQTQIAKTEHRICPTGGICGLLEGSNLIESKNYANITGTTEGVGGIVGYAKGTNSIHNCTNMEQVSIIGETAIGGIVGIVYGNVEITECMNHGSIKSTQLGSGGIAGITAGASIRKCYNTNHITGIIFVGGMVGQAVHISTLGYSLIEDCHNRGEIRSLGTSRGWQYYQQGKMNSYSCVYMGGIVGQAVKVKIVECSNEGNLIAQDASASLAVGQGGIVGEIRDSTITKCYNKGSIAYNAVSNSVGGIVGVGYYNAFVNNCYNTGGINGYQNVGGIVGWGEQTDIRYCYNNGTIKGSGQRIGGVAGSLEAHEVQSYTNNYFQYCYNAGTVVPLGSDTRHVGRINGYFDYYDVDYFYSLGASISECWGYIGNYRSGTNGSVYSDKNAMISAMLIHFASEFKSDSDNMNNGYPILKWQIEE